MKKPILTKILLIVIAVLLFFFTLLIGARCILSRDNVELLIKSIDVQEHLETSEHVNNLIKNKKLNDDLFSYINTIDYSLVVNDILDNLYNNNDFLIKKEDVEAILKKAIIIYENENSLDIYSNIKDDISELSDIISSNINDKDLIMKFSFIYNTANGYLFDLILFALFSFIIIVFFIEKGLGFGLVGLVFLLASIVMVIFEKKWFPNYINNINMIKYFNEEVVSKLITDSFFQCNSLLFIISICLLLVYVMIYFKKILRKIRIIFYDNYFGR
ncbi:MAG: hypothetical protein J6C46_11960 [Clostridia bacterium]|nr:hypothetical protein [Clostridia bacterium]